MKALRKLLLIGTAVLGVSCASKYNLYDYYQKHAIDTVNSGSTLTTKSKLLLRDYDKNTEAQLEFVAYRSDSAKYLIVGSQKLTKSVKVNDQVYQYGYKELFPKQTDEAIIHANSDFTIYYTHVSWASANAFLDTLPALKQMYSYLMPGNGEIMYVDYALSPDVRISLPKTKVGQQPVNCIVWVGKRRHYITLGQITFALNNIRTFN